MLRGYVRHWLSNVWGEFDRIKLTEIVGKDAKDTKDKANSKLSNPRRWPDLAGCRLHL